MSTQTQVSEKSKITPQSVYESIENAFGTVNHERKLIYMVKVMGVEELPLAALWKYSFNEQLLAERIAHDFTNLQMYGVYVVLTGIDENRVELETEEFLPRIRTFCDMLGIDLHDVIVVLENGPESLNEMSAR